MKERIWINRVISEIMCSVFASRHCTDARMSVSLQFERNPVCTWNTSEMSQMELKLRHEVRNPNA